MLSLSLLLAAGFIAADTLADPAPSPGTAAAAAVIVHHQPALPVVSMRLSVIAADPTGYEGAGHLLQQIAYPELRRRVRSVGGRTSMQRTPDALVYTVTGPVDAFDDLADALRATLETIDTDSRTRALAHRNLRRTRQREWETAGGHMRARLRDALFPGGHSGAGTRESDSQLESAPLSALRAAVYHPERVSIAAVGDVSTALVERAFSDLPVPPTASLTEAPEPTEPEALAAQVTRVWLAVGFPANGVDPAALTLIAGLAQTQLEDRLPEAQRAVEHWWTHEGQALAIIVAVPELRSEEARAVLGTMLADVRERLNEAEVEQAVAATRREMLFAARTPERMAELIGAFADRSGDEGAAQRFHESVGRSTLQTVTAVLEQLADGPAVRLDIPPQEIQR